MRKLVGAFLLIVLCVLAGPGLASDKVLIGTDELEKALGDPELRIIEVSVNSGQYERGHIPGAANVRWQTQLSDPIQRDIASREDLQALLRSIGVNRDSRIVLYGDNHNWFAAWALWVFDIYGIQDVRLLNGGREKWEREGRPMTRQVQAATEGNVSLAAADIATRAWLADVVALARNPGGTVLVDVRSPEEFSGALAAPVGSSETAMRAGHVPGAINLPWNGAVNADGTFKSISQLRRLYADAGIDGSKPVITYCRIGERASHTWFVLSKLLGYTAKNYDGSWTEYGNSVGAPIDNPHQQPANAAGLSD